MCATSKLSQLLELELQLLVSASASPWACVIQISCCWKSDWWRSSALGEAGLCDQGALWPCSPVMPGHSFAQAWQPAVQSGWAFPSCRSAVLPAWETESGVFEQGEGSALFAHLTFFLALLLLLIGGDGCWAGSPLLFFSPLGTCGTLLILKNEAKASHASSYLTVSSCCDALLAVTKMIGLPYEQSLW